MISLTSSVAIFCKFDLNKTFINISPKKNYMIKKTIRLVDKTYKNLGKKGKEQIYSGYYAMQFSDGNYFFSFQDVYNTLKVSGFYTWHGEFLCHNKKDDKGSDILYYFMGALTRSFDVSHTYDRLRYNIIKNIIYGNVNLEDVFINILNFNPVNEETLKIFTFQRENNKLKVYWKNEEVDIIQFVSDYLHSLKGTENEEALQELIHFSTSLLEKLFEDKKNRTFKRKEFDHLSIQKKLKLISENKISIQDLYYNQHDSYVEILTEALTLLHLEINDIDKKPSIKSRFRSFSISEEEALEIGPHKRNKNYKLQYYSVFFIETSFLLFFKTEKEINDTRNKIKSIKSQKIFNLLIKMRHLWADWRKRVENL